MVKSIVLPIVIQIISKRMSTIFRFEIKLGKDCLCLRFKSLFNWTGVRKRNILDTITRKRLPGAFSFQLIFMFGYRFYRLNSVFNLRTEEVRTVTEESVFDKLAGFRTKE